MRSTGTAQKRRSAAIRSHFSFVTIIEIVVIRQIWSPLAAVIN